MRLRKRLSAAVAALTIGTGAIAVLAPSAGAGEFDATATIIGITENLWEIETTFPCPGDGFPVVTFVTVLNNDETQPSVQVEIVSQEVTGPTTVQVLLPADAPAGDAVFELECSTEPGLDTLTLGEPYASVAVTKVVEGPAPEGATFTVDVACSGFLATEAADFGDVDAAQDPAPFDVALDYAATGGVAYVYSGGARDCDVSESQNGGATSTTIVEEELTIAEPVNYDVTVTNVFAIVAEPTFTG